MTVQTLGLNWQVNHDFAVKLEFESAVGDKYVAGELAEAKGRKEQELALALAVGF